jgi:hypothetical protein
MNYAVLLSVSDLLLESISGRVSMTQDEGKGSGGSGLPHLEAEGTANSADDYIVNDAGLTTHDA